MSNPQKSAEYEPTLLEHHSGVISGHYPVLRGWMENVVEPDPLAALKRSIADVMRRGSCVVQFSGGRDSSLVLAVAALVAREHGFAAPSALSVRYPEVSESEESSWQDLVVDHLRVPHEVIEVPRGGDELTAQLAVSSLRLLGPLMPPPVGVSLGRLGPRLAGRTLLTGEGGDEILGHARVTMFVAHWRRRRRPPPSMWAPMGELLLPRSARSALVQLRLRARQSTTWLRPTAEQAVVRAIVRDATDAPWDWRTARWHALQSRMWRVGSRSLDRVASAAGFRICHPLLGTEFVAALCARGGPRGLTTRTEAMRVLAGDLLPQAILTRADKASFNRVYADDGVRAFARDWDGSGVDDSLVDPERLRRAWTSDLIVGPSLAPLHLALSAALDRGWEPPGALGGDP